MMSHIDPGHRAEASPLDLVRADRKRHPTPRMDQFSAPRASNYGVNAYLIRGSMIAMDKPTKHAQSLLRLALDEAVEDDLMENNPLAGWRLRRRGRKPKEPHVDPFSAGEREAILSALDGEGRNLFEFDFWTGLRSSEMVGLDWGDIDWKGSHVHVRRALTQAADTPEEPHTTAVRLQEFAAFQRGY